jgi:hypothetical protein
MSAMKLELRSLDAPALSVGANGCPNILIGWIPEISNLAEEFPRLAGM